MDIKIPEEQWGAIVGAAVMQSITDENRDTLIKDAVTHLLTKSKDHYYGDHCSPLQKAFRDAMQRHAVKHIEEAFGGELQEKVAEVIREATEKAFGEECRREIITNIADAIGRGFKGY